MKNDYPEWFNDWLKIEEKKIAKENWEITKNELIEIFSPIIFLFIFPYYLYKRYKIKEKEYMEEKISEYVKIMRTWTIKK